MSRRVAGLSGRLFPLQYLTERLPDVAAQWVRPEQVDAARRSFARWWRTASSQCGPASGLRTLFDVVAVPLATLLQFRAHGLAFSRDQGRCMLETPARTPLALVLLPWAERPASLWRDVATAARQTGARWALVLAPPYLSIVEARGFAVRRSLDIHLPAAIESDALLHLLVLGRADAFDPAPRQPMPRIEALLTEASDYHAKVREDLQLGVTAALEALAAVSRAGDPSRTHRSTGPRASPVTAAEQALTIVYRVLFLLFAESRDLTPAHDPVYANAYAMSALCREALVEPSRLGLWDSLAAATRLSRAGCHAFDLGAPAFNGQLFARQAAALLESRPRGTRQSGRRVSARERAARTALVSLGSRPASSGRSSISYRDLGVEQLGAVYEHVLDLRADPAHRVTRKQSGTFYTPQPLAEFVVRRTLAPLVAGRSSDDVLALRVVDLAMGSGAFLVAACRYLARAYARALIEEGRMAAGDLDASARASLRRLVAERCLAGVDRNPVAVQLARLSLWLSTLSAGKPLSFLDHRLRVGDSLAGTTPDRLFDVRGSGARRMKPDRELPLFAFDAMDRAMRETVRPLEALLARHDDTVSDVRAKEHIWRRLSGGSGPLAPWRRAATLWCARWFWPATSSPPAASELRALCDAVLRGDRTLRSAHVDSRLESALTVGARVRFFHWPLEFPDVFYDESGRTCGGFDAVIGNPPWEMLRRDPSESQDLDRRQLVRFIRESGLYPSCDRGHLNLYQPFLERALSIARPGGRIGLILPWGLAADDGAASLRRRLLDETALDTLVGLDNRHGLFPIHRGLRFLVMVAASGHGTHEVRARFGVTTGQELDVLPGHGDETESGAQAYPIPLTSSQIRRVGGSTFRFPDLRRPGDLDLLERLTAALPRLGERASWSARFGRELNATESRPSCGATGLPVLEGKDIGRFQVTTGRGRRIERTAALRLLPDARFDAPRLGYRDVSGVANSRSLIAAVLPAGVVTTHTVLCLRTALPIEQQHFLCGLFNSFVLNAVTRLLMGGHITTSLVEDLPVPAWRGDSRDRLIALLAAEAAARPDDVKTQATLEAQVARLYNMDAGTFDDVLASFPLVPREHRALAAQSFRRVMNVAG